MKIFGIVIGVTSSTTIGKAMVLSVSNDNSKVSFIAKFYCERTKFCGKGFILSSDSRKNSCVQYI